MWCRSSIFILAIFDGRAFNHVSDLRSGDRVHGEHSRPIVIRVQWRIYAVGLGLVVGDPLFVVRPRHLSTDVPHNDWRYSEQCTGKGKRPMMLGMLLNQDDLPHIDLRAHNLIQHVLHVVRILPQVVQLNSTAV